MKLSNLGLFTSVLLASTVAGIPTPDSLGSGIDLSKRSGQYKVESGDTGASIAQKLGVDLAALKAANGFVDWNNIWLGTVLTVPDAGSSAPAASSSTVASGGQCEGAGGACTGDITYYEGGMGACGWNIAVSDMQIALPHGLMGAQSNGNPYCGRSVTIQAPDGQPVKATVGDKCMGCEGDSIDLTDAVFKAVAPNGDGRVKGVKWYFDQV